MAKGSLLTRISVSVAVVALALGMNGCAKRTIDPESTGSVPVEGTGGSLMKFCDGTILIYWTPNIVAGESDDYEFIVYDGCDENGNIINGDNAQQKPPKSEDVQTGEEDEEN